MVRIFDFIAEQKLEADVRMLLQVHDELVFEIRKERLEGVVPTLVELMTNVVDEEARNGVPIEVEVKAGPNLGELEPYEST
jgi:DNA polymerase-1